MTTSRMEVEGCFDATTGSGVSRRRCRNKRQRQTVRDHRQRSRLRPDVGPDAYHVRGPDHRSRAVDRRTVQWILETHLHADHLSAARHLAETLGGRLVIGRQICAVQRHFGALFNVGDDCPRDGSQFDRLFDDGDRFAIGGLEGRVIHTPGHTPADLTYLIGDGVTSAAFVGDTLFMPDYGTARCDFPGGDARTLYRSIRRLLALPDETRVYVCHDDRPGGRPVAFESTVGEQRRANVHIHDGVDENPSWRCALRAIGRSTCR